MSHLRLVLSDADQSAARPRQHPSCDPAIAAQLAIAAAERHVINCCRAEHAAEKQHHLIWRQAITARRGELTKERDNALVELNRARDARRAAVTELERLENALAVD